jgi:hypothetical protein
MASPSSVRTFRVGADGAVARSELVEKGAPSNPLEPSVYSAPTVTGDTSLAAAAYLRGERGRGSRELVVRWLDPETGVPAGAARTIARGDLGAPAILLEGTTLHIVWSSRADARAPYRLQHAEWASGAAAPTPAVELPTPTARSLAPAVAKVGRQLALAWMDAADERSGAVWAGFAPSLEEAARVAVRRSGSDVRNARDPEWGPAGERAVLVWTEHDGPTRVASSWCGAP